MSLTEGRFTKGGHNQPNTSTARPPKPKGSGGDLGQCERNSQCERIMRRLLDFPNDITINLSVRRQNISGTLVKHVFVQADDDVKCLWLESERVFEGQSWLNPMERLLDRCWRWSFEEHTQPEGIVAVA